MIRIRFQGSKLPASSQPICVGSPSDNNLLAITSGRICQTSAQFLTGYKAAIGHGWTRANICLQFFNPADIFIVLNPDRGVLILLQN